MRVKLSDRRAFAGDREPVAALGDLPRQVHLAAEAVPVHRGRAELLQDLHRAALALARVDDDGLSASSAIRTSARNASSCLPHSSSGTQ
jgi:hypothetical protein